MRQDVLVLGGGQRGSDDCDRQLSGVMTIDVRGRPSECGCPRGFRTERIEPVRILSAGGLQLHAILSPHHKLTRGRQTQSVKMGVQ